MAINPNAPTTSELLQQTKAAASGPSIPGPLARWLSSATQSLIHALIDTAIDHPQFIPARLRVLWQAIALYHDTLTWREQRAAREAADKPPQPD